MRHFFQSRPSMPMFRQFLKFSLVGCLNVIISFFIFYVCYEKWHVGTSLFSALGVVGNSLSQVLEQIGIRSIDAALANVVGYAGGMINSFFLNKTWTFNVRHGTLGQMRRFFVLNVFGLALSTVIIFFLIDVFGMPYVITWFLTITFVMILNFLGSKYWSFVEPSARSKAT